MSKQVVLDRKLSDKEIDNIINNIRSRRRKDILPIGNLKIPVVFELSLQNDNSTGYYNIENLEMSTALELKYNFRVHIDKQKIKKS